MAATCQERGITHVKDVFSATSPVAKDKEPSAGSFFFGFSTGTKPAAEINPRNGVAGGSKPGGFLLRNGQNKNVDIMEIPVPPPPRRQKESESSIESLSSPPGKLVKNSKDTYLAPRSVTAQRNSSARSSDDFTRKQQDSITVAVVHKQPLGTLPSPPVATGPTSPKRSAPLPPGPTSPMRKSQLTSLARAAPPPPPLFSSPPAAPPPPPQFSPSASPTRVAPLPPRSSTYDRRPAKVSIPSDIPPPPPPPPPMNGSPIFKATQKDTNQLSATSTPVKDRSSHSNRYSSDSHALHIETTSPLQHSHRREGSGDYTTGSLFDGDDDRDIINGSHDDSPVFTTGHSVVQNKPSSPEANLFTKKGQSENDDYKRSSHYRFSKLGSGTDNESSILTNTSEHGAASSGYFSELSTTSDTKVVPSPPFTKKNQKATNPETASSSSSFEEEEFTVNFGDDKFAETNQTKIYHEYDGEDFGKYLQDDDPYPQSTTTLTRRVQKRKQQQQYSNSPRTLPPPNRGYQTPQKKAGFKDKVKALTLTRSEKKQPHYHGTPQQPKTSIHQMSFMNSKMGMYASEEELTDYMTRDMETKSDLGGLKKSPVAAESWHKDTLSMSTLRRAKRELDQRPMFSSSTPNLADPGFYGGAGSPPSSPRYGESFSDFGADIKKKKKVNRFKFWKVFGKKKSKESSSSQLGIGNQQPQCVDVRL